MRHCEPPDGESADKSQVAAPAHCNARGLTELGAHVVDALMERNMLIDPDHMSVLARDQLLHQLEERGYPGVLSSHSWATPDAYPRIYALGGFVAPYAGDSTGFFQKWQRHLGWADERYYFGFGFGADMNGLGAQGDPRGADVSNPVSYPFTGLGGVTVGQQHSGERVYDVNVDGVSHYGLYPDWVEDLRMIGGEEDGAAIVDDMSRGAEAYLQTWERAEGIAPDSCRNPERRLDVATFRQRVRPGMTTLEVMRAVGQPFTRLGSEYGVCALSATGGEVRMEIGFDDSGRVAAVTRTS
jgi:hypothetical protein